MTKGISLGGGVKELLNHLKAESSEQGILLYSNN